LHCPSPKRQCLHEKRRKEDGFIFFLRGEKKEGTELCMAQKETSLSINLVYADGPFGEKRRTRGGSSTGNVSWPVPEKGARPRRRIGQKAWSRDGERDSKGEDRWSHETVGVQKVATLLAYLKFWRQNSLLGRGGSGRGDNERVGSRFLIVGVTGGEALREERRRGRNWRYFTRGGKNGEPRYRECQHSSQRVGRRSVKEAGGVELREIRNQQRRKFLTGVFWLGRHRRGIRRCRGKTRALS